MSHVPGMTYLEWGKNGSGVVLSRDGRRGRTMPLDAFPDSSAVGGAILVSRHSDGVGLATAAAASVSAGRAAAAYVEGDFGHLTPLTGVALKTLHCWKTRDPSGHPAARIADFTSGCTTALADVIAFLFDPRWYLDLDRPERRSAAEARLGLTPRWDHQRSSFRACVTTAWMSKTTPASAADFFGRMYLRRIAEKNDPAAAERYVGKYFVKCLFAAWTDASRPAGSEPFFEPRLLFDAAAVAARAREA